MLEVHLGILNEQLQYLFAICQQISLNSGFRENSRLNARKPYIWAVSWENLYTPYMNNKDADQPGHVRSLISTYNVRCPNSIIPVGAVSVIPRLYLASVDGQAGLILTWSQTSKDRFSHINIIFSPQCAFLLVVLLFKNKWRMLYSSRLSFNPRTHPCMP